MYFIYCLYRTTLVCGVCLHVHVHARIHMHEMRGWAIISSATASQTHHASAPTFKKLSRHPPNPRFSCNCQSPISSMHACVCIVCVCSVLHCLCHVWCVCACMSVLARVRMCAVCVYVRACVRVWLGACVVRAVCVCVRCRLAHAH